MRTASDSILRKRLIRLAHQRADLRSYLLPLLVREGASARSAALKGWKKGPVPVALNLDEGEIIAYEEGVTFGAWGIVKRKGNWSVTHIPSGLAAFHPGSLKAAKAFVEALVATNPALATVRKAQELTTTHRDTFMKLLRANPSTWPTLPPGTKVPNRSFSYEGNLPVKTLTEVKVPLKSSWKKVLSVIAEKGKIARRDIPKVPWLEMLAHDLISASGTRAAVWTEKGEAAYQNGYYLDKEYV